MHFAQGKPYRTCGNRKDATQVMQRLELMTTSLRNVTISNASDVVYYEVTTPAWARTTTRITRRDSLRHTFDTVGEVRRDEAGKPVAVSVRGSAFVPISEFLREGEASAARSGGVGFRGKDGKSYMWRRRSGGHLELVQEHAPDESPLAVFHTHKRYLLVLRMSRLPYLEVDTSLFDTLDTLILSFLLVVRPQRHG